MINITHAKSVAILPGGTNRHRVPCRINWSVQADTRLIRLRADGTSVRAIATAFGVSRSAVADRVHRLGLALPARPGSSTRAALRPVGLDLLSDPQRDPLPAGHPISWGIITRGTSLEGCPYSIPSQGRPPVSEGAAPAHPSFQASEAE